jgi:hypothetical protein
MLVEDYEAGDLQVVWFIARRSYITERYHMNLEGLVNPNFLCYK